MEIDKAEMCIEINRKFWESGYINDNANRIVLRNVMDCDKEGYIKLQEENAISKSMIKKEEFRELLWEGYHEPEALMCSIIVNGEYAGYCGIKDTTKEVWELVAEILNEWKRKGIGYKSICIMLDEMGRRLGVSEFWIRVDPENYASQALVEKIGAVPDGVSEFLLHSKEDIVRCEEDNINYIDDRLIKLADKFGVEPRILLSHVLKYRLDWNVIRS